MASDSEGGLSANAMLAIGLVLCAGLVIVTLLGTRFLKDTPPPPPMPVAAPAEHSVNTTLKFTEGYYKATVEEDAKKLKLPTPELSAMTAPLPFFDELDAPRSMKPEKDVIETPHLRIATQVSKEWSMTGSAQRMRVEHIMLSITNKSAKPVAYRVDTFMPESARCKSKGAILQNAVALKPGETMRRTECIWSKGYALDVKQIQVIELSDLGYFYVSRLIPTQALLDERYTAGHEPPNKLKPCTFVPWREIRTAAEPKDGVRWGDVIDFYARHDCDEYSFFPSYRRWTAAGPLPAQAGNATPSPLEPSAKSR